jgi:hypothetical protein
MVDTIEISDLTTNPFERFILAFDERNIKDDTNYSAVFNVMLLSNIHPRGIFLACVRLIRNNLTSWKVQIQSVIEKIMDKFSSVIEPYFIADSHAAHIGIVAPNFKMQAGRHTLSLVPDLIHLLSHLANVLGRDNTSANLFLRIPKVDNTVCPPLAREQRVSISFGGLFFDTSTTWQKFRDGPTTDIHWLLNFYSNRILDGTLADMSEENYPDRNDRAGVFEKLIWFLQRFCVNNSLNRSEESKLSGKVHYVFTLNCQ